MQLLQKNPFLLAIWISIFSQITTLIQGHMELSSLSSVLPFIIVGLIYAVYYKEIMPDKLRTHTALVLIIFYLFGYFLKLSYDNELYNQFSTDAIESTPTFVIIFNMFAFSLFTILVGVIIVNILLYLAGWLYMILRSGGKHNV